MRYGLTETHQLKKPQMLPNFNLKPGEKLSDILIEKKIDTFHKAVKYVHKLSYGRNRVAENYWTIVSEGKGTCSTKHAFLTALANENNIYSIRLVLSMYFMSSTNTPKIAEVLNKYKLDHILEAHSCLCYGGMHYDYTFPNTLKKPWETSMISEEYIDVDQIGEYKITQHKSLIDDWIKRDNIPYTLDEIWSIREECIEAFAKP